MGKKLTADKIKVLEENANILMEQGASQADIDLMTSEFIEEFGIDDAIPEKKNEVQGLNAGVGTSVGSSAKSPVSSIKTEQNVGLSPSGKKGIDILRGASVKRISPTKTAIPQTPKKKKSKVEELRKSIQQKVAFGEPLTTDEVSEVRKIASNVFLPLDGLKDGEVNAVLAGAQNKQNQQLISKSRNDQYQKQLKDRIVSGEILPEDIKGMYDISGFAPPDMNFEKLANDWNAENLKIKQKIDSELLNESTKIDEYIIDLDDKIKNIESKQSKKEVEKSRTPKSQIEIEEKSATDGAISNLKSIKYKAQQYLDYLSEKAIDASKGEIIKRVNKIQGIRDEKGLVKDVVSLEQVVDDYISTQPTEKQNLLLRKKSYLVESLVASEYIIPKANEVFYQKAESIISDVPQSAKQLFKRVTGEIDVKDGEEKYYDTQQQFAIANNAASLYFMDEVARTNQAFESIVSLPNVRNAVGGKLDVLKQQYDSGQISVMDYKLKRLQALSLNPQTSEYAKEYFRKIQNAQERFISKIDKFLQSKVPDFAKFTEVDESGNIVSIAGMKPMKFTQKMTELQTAKTESLNEAASMYATDIENRAIERRGELFEDGVGSWMYSGFKKGTHRFVEGMAKWAYDNTGISAFDDVRKAAKQLGYIASIPYESKEVQNIMDIEAGDYSKALNLYYITGMASESAPYMLAAMAAGVLTGGLAEGALLGMGLSEGIGAAITLSRAGRIAQKTIAAISGGTSDAFLNMTANYNDLIKEGYSKEQAKQIAFDAFKNELPVDILSGAVEMDALFSATSKPTIKNIIKGGASKAGSIFIEEPIQEVYQGYSLEQAKGTNQSLSDYAFFDKEGFNNLMGGFSGGLGTGAVTNAMGIAKNALSWNRLYNVSTADMQNAVRYAGLTQMVATTSEMQNSINLDLLKSAQSIAQEEYQKIPNNEKAQKEKTKNEYVNRTIAYEYAKSINKAIQNGTNIEDVHEHYKAHNEAISEAYSTLASLANEKNKPMYKKQADYYASLAQKSEIGQQTPIYSLITPKGRVFITEQTAKTLAEGSIQQKNDAFNKAVRAGDIVGIQVVDDSKTAQSLIKKFDDAKLSQQLEVQQSQGGATEVGQPTQTNVQTPVEGTTEIQTTEGVVDDPNISPESTTITPQAGSVVGGEVEALAEAPLPILTKSKIDEIENEINERNYARTYSVGELGNRVEITTEIGGRKVAYTKDEINRANEIEKRLGDVANKANLEQIEKEELALNKSVLQRHLNELKAAAKSKEQAAAKAAEAPPSVLERGVGEEVEAKRIETEAKIKRKDLFSDGGVFANELGGSGVNSVPTNHSERNGIEFVQFSNPNTGIVDVIMTGKSDNDFVGYYRIYENGKATNKWSSKFENQSRNKEDFKTMISGVQEMLPQGHEYTEKTSISTDGLRIWNQQLNRGYELQYDDKGNLITNRVAINGDAINNELGIAVNKGNFENVSVTNNADMKKVKEALLPYLQKFGLNESNIHFENGTVEIDLPVLKSNKAVEQLLGKPKEATPQAGVVGGEVGIKNEGKAEAPTKENVTERLNINNPFYKKVEDALVKLGLIEKYNPETGTGDVVGGYAQQTTDGGFSVGKMLFSQDGSISYFDGDVKVSFDKNGNVISENTKEAKQKAVSLEIEGKKEQITNLEKTRDSEAFKYKEVTETDVLGNKKKGKRLKTEQELKESTDKINAAIDKAKSELSDLEQSLQATPKEETKQPIEIDESTPFDLSTALQTKKEEQDAIQKQSTTEEVLLNERPEMGLQEVGEGNAQVEAVAKQGSQEEKISSRIGEAVTINIGGKAITGVVRQDEGGKLTVESAGKIIEVDNETKFLDYASPVRISDDGNGIEINGEVYVEVEYRTDNFGEYAIAKKEDGIFKKITSPEIIEEIKYQAALMRLDELSDAEAEQILLKYESKRETKAIAKKGISKSDGISTSQAEKSEEEIRLQEALDELSLIEKIADEELAQVESKAKLIQSTPSGSNSPKTYLVQKNNDGSYSATLNGRKVRKGKYLDLLGSLYELATAEQVNQARELLKQQVAELKEEVEAKFYGRNSNKNTGLNQQGIIEKTKNVENETPKTTTNRETGENLVGGNQENIPTDADGNRQREEEIAEDTPKQGEKGVGVVTGASTPVISEMDRAVLDAMKPTFEIEFIPNAKFLNTSAPLENKSSQDTVKRRYEIIKKLLECL